MQLSSQSDYALRAVRHISTLPRKLGSINFHRRGEKHPAASSGQDPQDLTRGGILRLVPGLTGAYRPGQETPRT